MMEKNINVDEVLQRMWDIRSKSRELPVNEVSDGVYLGINVIKRLHEELEMREKQNKIMEKALAHLSHADNYSDKQYPLDYIENMAKQTVEKIEEIKQIKEQLDLI